LPVPPIFAPSTGNAEFDREALEGRACWTGPARYVNSNNDAGLDLSALSQDDAVRAVIDWLAARGRGEAKVTYRMRDWLFSRQRYWGEPFPIVHCEDGRIELLPEDQLPLELPEMDDFRPGGSPESPLQRATDWVATTASSPLVRKMRLRSEDSRFIESRSRARSPRRLARSPAGARSRRRRSTRPRSSCRAARCRCGSAPPPPSSRRTDG